MDCARVLRLWPRWIDGSLPADHKRAVACHLASCRSCAGRWRRADPVGALGAFGDPPQAPPGLAAAVLAALPARPPRDAARPPLVPALLAIVLLAAVRWGWLPLGLWLVPRAGTGLAALGALLGSLAAALADAATVAAAVLSWGAPALVLCVAVELAACWYLLRARPR